MTMQPSLAHTESKIAYFQFFRIYHDPAVLSGFHLLFNNSRQRIPWSSKCWPVTTSDNRCS